MDDRDVRLECLKIAQACEVPANIVALAKAFADFVIGAPAGRPSWYGGTTQEPAGEILTSALEAVVASAERLTESRRRLREAASRAQAGRG
jgi:hypothetical protein